MTKRMIGGAGLAVLALVAGVSACSSNDPPVSAPSITLFQVTPATITERGSATVEWASANAVACEGDGTLPGWTGNKIVTGQQMLTVAAAGSYQARLVCRDAQGRTTSATAALTVTTVPTPVSIDSFTASPADFMAGGTTHLSWTTRGAANCVAQGALPGWTGSLPLTGEQRVEVVAAGAFDAQLVCSDADGNSVQTAVAVTVTPADRFALANGCFALKSVAANAFAVRNAGGTYKASAPTADTAYPFFMKPTALGKYLFFARNGTTDNFLAVNGSAVGSATTASDSADWTVNTDLPGTFTVASASAGKSLAVDANGNLILADAGIPGNAAKFRFDRAVACTEFPEITVNATGDTFKGRGVAQPALGFADVHIHISARDFLGHAHYGEPFNKFGVTQALGNCSVRHGTDGRQDFVGNVLGGNPTGSHNTVGWPTFTDWPARHSLLHEGTYYKWIERAWQAGLRLAVADTVENEALCTLQRNAVQNPTLNCNEMDSAEEQTGFLRRMQDYIDAQNGGPGKGWFRIVTTPAEARSVINDGKLAVVLGIEISHLFNCGIYRTAGQEVPFQPGYQETLSCTQADVDRELDRLYTLGVRQMFPIHEFDNAFGGNGIFDGVVLNLGNRADTGEFWSTYDCPAADGVNGGYLYRAGAIMNSEQGQAFPPPQMFGNPIGDGLANDWSGNGRGQFPLYNTSLPQCNARALTDVGRYAIGKMMDKKVIVEVDHLELKVKTEVIQMAKDHKVNDIPRPYPVVSTHGGHGGITNQQGRAILALGGIIYDSNNNGKDQVGRQAQVEALKAPNILFGLGYGSDINGLSGQPAPRSTPNAGPVVYPFTLFNGPGWGSQFTGIAPVRFDKQVSGVREYSIDDDGIAHYGLVADFVEELRIEGGEHAVTNLFNSAEAYLQMWERTVGTRCDVAGCPGG